MKILIIFISLIGPFLSTAFSDEIPLKIAVVQEFGQFNPITLNLASTESFLHFVLRGLTAQDDKGVLIPDLAESIPNLKNKSAQEFTDQKIKKIKATWQIKKSALWSDGKPVICQDWWLGWQAGLSANTMTQEKTMYSKIEKIEFNEKDPTKCTVTYATNSWAFDRDLPYPIPFHLENAVFEKYKNQKEAYDQNSIYVTAANTPGLYNGPYVVEEFKLGSHIILSTNPYFFGEKAKIKKISIEHIGESNILQAHLKTKSINMISAVGFPPDLAFSMAQNKDQTYQVFFQDSPIFQGLFINHEGSILSDINVRKALSMAIDKKKLTDAFFNSKLKPAETFIPPNFSEFAARPASFNRKEAQKVLDLAGWKVVDNKKFRFKNGKELIIDFKTSSGIKILETIQVFICSEFAQIQVGCLIKNQPPRILLGDTISKGGFELAMYGNSILPDTSLTSLFSSKEIPTKDNSWTGANNLRWKSAKADVILTKFDQESSKTKRSLILKDLEKEILDQVAFIPVYHRREAAVIPQNLQGLNYLGKGTNFMFPERWQLK